MASGPDCSREIGGSRMQRPPTASSDREHHHGGNEQLQLPLTNQAQRSQKTRRRFMALTTLLGFQSDLMHLGHEDGRQKRKRLHARLTARVTCHKHNSSRSQVPILKSRSIPRDEASRVASALGFFVDGIHGLTPPARLDYTVNPGPTFTILDSGIRFIVHGKTDRGPRRRRLRDVNHEDRVVTVDVFRRDECRLGGRSDPTCAPTASSDD